MHSFQDVLKHFEGVTGLANALGISSQAVSQWKEQIPPGRAYQIQIVSNGRFKAEKLPVRRSERARH